MDPFADTPGTPQSTRRQFARNLALLGAAPLAATEAVAAEAPMSPAEALLEIVKLRYGRFLTPAQLANVQRSIQRQQQAATLMQAVPLRNGDEPAFAFRADLP